MVFAIVAISIAGCVTTPDKVDRAVGAGQPNEYKEGYAPGCDSGYVAAGHPYYKFSKDVRRYVDDAIYKNGWDDGFAICKSQYESTRRSLR